MSLSKVFGSGLKWSRRLGQMGQALLGARKELVGTDSLGNQYYKKFEMDPDLGVEKEHRWMVSPRGHNHAYTYDPNRTPVEWVGWLRGARDNPPTPQELERNEMSRKHMQMQVKELKVKEERRRRLKREEEAAAEEGAPLSIEDSGDRKGSQAETQSSSSKASGPTATSQEPMEFWQPGGK
uniref:NADH dehydrogenase [ubiquinone] 1 alpha subcomplex subunit 12 n=1 Tax=Chloropicon laureae TaxID=464258 RepID=A0A7S3E307_9CHLO|mmetsp:Transcript_4856/g.12377  ORF Transcript_4856/g.12377 Transcript_4856/m.12377 type:complete len:181 (+) Transcript_4856:254-796(+)|eukprot:CAMPEP_0197499772 /NCGR_PEP_ID=MMETSP1311-20131121/61192_1 /TAXON_ID=464262 /ORGANISM="Genus nov. species nov., Strain RCC856" /LENGTH=180 /DNA_ID=CAMNT_0043045519 /DNA_START=197 /DNA_END=739 /DNA_ORIENTATION=+